MADGFVNKVSESGIITLNLEDFFPKEDFMAFDLKDFLFMGLILKEKDYREALKTYNWSHYENKIAGVDCSADAIIPVWAYMLAATYLQPVANFVAKGNEKRVREDYFLNKLGGVNIEDYKEQRIVIKGCGDIEIPETAYTAITVKLLPYVKSIMYGEPCSTVPVFKKK